MDEGFRLKLNNVRDKSRRELVESEMSFSDENSAKIKVEESGMSIDESSFDV